MKDARLIWVMTNTTSKSPAYSSVVNNKSGLQDQVVRVTTWISVAQMRYFKAGGKPERFNFDHVGHPVYPGRCAATSIRVLDSHHVILVGPLTTGRTLLQPTLTRLGFVELSAKFCLPLLTKPQKLNDLPFCLCRGFPIAMATKFVL